MMKQNEKPKQGIPRLLEISGEKNTPLQPVFFSPYSEHCVNWFRSCPSIK